VTCLPRWQFKNPNRSYWTLGSNCTWPGADCGWANISRELWESPCNYLFSLLLWHCKKCSKKRWSRVIASLGHPTGSIITKKRYPGMHQQVW